MLLATIAGAHLAREGTTLARVTTFVIIVGVAAAWQLHGWWIRRRDADPARLANKLARLQSPELGGRAERAVRLVHASDGSGDALAAGLARVHLERLLSAIRPEDLWEAGRKHTVLWRNVVLGIVATSVVLLAIGPLRVIEGLNVLVAYGNRAPITLSWVDSIICRIQPPAYLGERERIMMGFVDEQLPRGTTISVHATPNHEGRTLVLTDGTKEVPFIDDGRGRVVATWVVDGDVELQVAARFGDVLIAQEDSFSVEALEDEVPKVVVQDAPRTLRLIDVQEVPIRYEASDDHGLTQVDLVLRAGGKESRRVLAKYDGRMPFDVGSAVLRRDDRFLQGAHVPVEVTIEARDNDPVGGPKWGRGASIMLLPPAVGEAEAMRYEAVSSLRDAVVDMLAARLMLPVPTSEAERARLAKAQRDAHREFAKKVREVTTARYGGLEVSRRLRSLYLGQLERMEAVLGICPSTVSADACATGVKRLHEVTGDAALAFDLAGQALSTRDSVLVARRLADVAGEAAEGARLVRQPESERGRTRLNAAITVLSGGGESLSRLGGLGGDLGEVVSIGVRRIDRCMTRDDTQCAELAASDLAARLRRPHPSFSGGGGRRGTEAGGMAGLDDASAGAGAMESFDDKGSEIAELAKEHASRIDEVAKTMSEALSAVDMESMREAAREHARYVRDAVRGLPTMADDMSSVEGGAMLMREQAERMADALDRGALSDAEQAARNALNAADQARRAGERDRDLFGQRTPLSQDVDRARKDLEREHRWVQEQLERFRKAASERARDKLREASKSESEMADRTEDLAERARSGDNPLPRSTMDMLKEAQDAMREASRALGRADGEEAMTRQREAQRLLEMASESLDESSASNDASSSSKSKPPKPEAEPKDEQEGEGKDVATGRVDIPSADQFKGPEAFRKRVVEGLSQPADPSLREAVRRYAEGLLR